MSQSRALGLGLLALGGILGGLVLLWLLATAASGDLRAGGFVLGLILAAILGLPPVGVGLYILWRGKQQEAEEREFFGRRQVLEQDRLFRARIASEARQQAARLRRLETGEALAGRSAARLSEVADQLEGAAYAQSSWYEAVRLSDEDLDALRRYDELVSERLRRIARRIDRLELGRAEVGPLLLEEIQAWEHDLDQRLELLRGQRPPSAAPSELLADGASVDRGPYERLRRGDAVTHEETDYLVDATLTYFSGGKTWRRHRLKAEQAERWLFVGPRALTLILMERAEPIGEEGEEYILVDGQGLTLKERGSASVSVDSPAGREEGVAVDYWHYDGGGSAYHRERWPDGTRAYRGTTIRPAALEIWPAERAPAGG